MKRMDCNVVVYGPAVGKTYLANYDKRFVDLDEIKGRYKYGLENGKLNRGTIVNSNSTKCVIKILEEEIKKIT